MRSLRFLLLLAVVALPARAQQSAAGAAAPKQGAPIIILPGAALPQTGPGAAGGQLVLPPSGLILPEAPKIIVFDAPVIAKPEPMIIPAARALADHELAPAKFPSESELKRLADSLTPKGAQAEFGAKDAGRSAALDARFDGGKAPEADDWDRLAPQFAQSPAAPSLGLVAAAGRSLVARFLPQLYRRVPVRAAYDRGPNPSTGHVWTPEGGHLIEINPVGANARGEVPTAFGHDGRTLVQQKIERLMGYSHEYLHVIFDAVVGRKEDHPITSVFSAMTEGFAITGEQLLIEKLLDNILTLGLGPRDASDLLSIARARRDWLETKDTHYSEGILSWHKAYAEGGVRGVVEFLTSLSSHRMSTTPRSDIAYQLALGEPKLLSAYVGHDDASAERRGLLAYSKAARGEKLTEEEARDAAAVVDHAGPGAWRRVFERALFADKRLEAPKRAAEEGGRWWKKKAEPMASVVPVFALARLSPAAGAALSRFLAETIRTSGGAMRLFEKAGPNEKLSAIALGAESLPWDEADRKAFDDGLMRWLLGTGGAV